MLFNWLGILHFHPYPQLPKGVSQRSDGVGRTFWAFYDPKLGKVSISNIFRSAWKIKNPPKAKKLFFRQIFPLTAVLGYPLEIQSLNQSKSMAVQRRSIFKKVKNCLKLFLFYFSSKYLIIFSRNHVSLLSIIIVES